MPTGNRQNRIKNTLCHIVRIHIGTSPYITGALFVFRFPVDPLNPGNRTAKGLIIRTDVLGRFAVALPQTPTDKVDLIEKYFRDTKMYTRVVCVDAKNDFWQKFGLKSKINF